MLAEAEQHFRTALHLRDDADGHRFYGRWLAENGRGPEAVAHLSRALVLAPGSVDTRSLLMRLDAARGADAELHALAQQSLAIDPGDSAAAAYLPGSAPLPVASNNYAGWFAYGFRETRAGQNLEAAIAARQALKFDPRSADALNNLGYPLGRLGFRAEARDALTRALLLRPDFALARNNLRWIDSGR